VKEQRFQLVKKIVSVVRCKGSLRLLTVAVYRYWSTQNTRKSGKSKQRTESCFDEMHFNCSEWKKKEVWFISLHESIGDYGLLNVKKSEERRCNLYIRPTIGENGHCSLVRLELLHNNSHPNGRRKPRFGARKLDPTAGA